MAQAGFTPIQLYFSTTAAATPSAGNLANGELAVNITDGRLFYKDNGGTVRVLAGTGGSGVVAGSNTQVQFNNNGVFGASANMVFNGTRLTVADLADSGLTSGRVTYASTGGALVDSANLTFDGTNLTLGGGTANGVAYLNGSKVLTTGSALTFDGTALGVNGGLVSDSNLLVQINSPTGQQKYFASNKNGAYGMIFGYDTQNDLARFRVIPNTAITFAVNDTEQMRLTSTGLGIGTSSPGARLDVVGAAGTGSIGLFRNTTATSTTTFANPIVKITSGASGADSSIQFTDAITANGYVSWKNSTLNFSTNSGINHMMLDSSGNLGLGVTPSAWATVTALQIKNGSLYGYSTAETGLTGNAYYNAGWKYIATGFATKYTQGEVGNGIHAWFTAPSGTAGNAISFTQAMTLDASGNLGVGTTSMSRRFQVQAATTGSVDSISWTDGATDTGYLGTVAGGGTRIWAGGFLAFGAGGGASYTERARINSSGELLLGTSGASGNRLIINGVTRTMRQGDRTDLSFQTDNTVGAPAWPQRNLVGHYYTGSQDAVTLRVPSGGNANTGSYDILQDGTHIWYAAGGSTASGSTATERARITNAGELLVGTASVSGTGGLTILPNASVGAPQIQWNRATSAGTTTAQVFYNAGTSVGGITYTNTTTAYVTSSDYRLKNTIAPMTGALAKVAALKPVTYKWNADGSDGEGFIAHELAEVVPQCVTGEKDAVDADGKPQYQGIDTSFLVATLTAAIQELKAEFDAYKATHP
jgi:hypothetical protein